jgi:hypothetical protein
MLSSVVISTLLQTACLGAIVLCVRNRWASSAGFIFALTVWTYHSGSEILNQVFPGRNAYRGLISDVEVGTAALWCTAVVASFTVTYILSRPYRAHSRARASNAAPTVLDNWPVMVTVAGLLYIIAVSPSDIRGDSYWSSGVMDQFVILGVVLASLAVTKGASARAAPVMCAQGILLSFVGNRTAVVLSTLMFLSVTLRRDPKQGFRLTAAAVGLMISAALVISSARAVAGRGDLLSNASTRVGAIESGTRALTRPTDVIDGVIDDSVYRLDGNSFAAMVVDRLAHGFEPVGPALITNSARLAIPNFIFSSKMELPVEARNEKALIISHFGLFAGLDYVPTLISLMIASLGLAGGVGAGALVGIGYARADRYLARTSTPIALLLGLALVQCAAQIEQGFTTYFVAARGVLVIGIVAVLYDRFVGGVQRSVASRGGPAAEQKRPCAPFTGAVRPLIGEPRVRASVRGARPSPVMRR